MIYSKDLEWALPIICYSFEFLYRNYRDYNAISLDEKWYRVIIGSLLYLTTSGPDIMFSICSCAHYQSCLKESHLKVVKRIFKYLIGIIDRIMVPKKYGFQSWRLFHAGFACCTDRKSTSCTWHILGQGYFS